MLKLIVQNKGSLKRFFSGQNVKLPNTQLLIDGKWINSVKGKTFDNINPSTEQVISKIQYGGVEDVDLAVKAAKKSFEEGTWRRASVYERAAKLYKIADLMERDSEELAMLEALEFGRPMPYSRIQVSTSAEIFRYFAGLAVNNYGEQVPLPGPHFCYTRQEPVGVCGQIIPWNAPIVMVAYKVPPCLAAGNSTVLKPAELTPLTALKMAELALEAGVPEGVFNVVTGDGETGNALVHHPLVDKIAFTGSGEVGFNILRNAGLKRVSLELGGKSPTIVLNDANLDESVATAAFSAIANNGQVCMAGSRIFVQEGIYPEFSKAIIEYTKKAKVGDPLNEENINGPVITSEQREKIARYIDIGQKEGASLIVGGKKMKQKGYFFEPTVFTDLKDEMTIAKEEIFGPVVSLFKFKTIDEVIKRANATTYGLTGTILSQDLNNIFHISNKLRVGQVFVNNWITTTGHTPFGGYKNSGLGRELGLEGFKAYTETKTVIIAKGEEAGL